MLSKATSGFAKVDKVDVEDELQFYFYLFAKMEKKLLQVLPLCTCPNFGFQIKLNPQYDRAYVLDVDAKSSATKLFSSLKATRQAILLSYIV